MAIGEEKGDRAPALARLDEYKQQSQKSILARLEERGIRMLWAFVERDASNWRFWVKISLTMLVINTALPLAIYLYFLGRDYGYLE